jgi:hypothetical protein
MQLAWPNAKGSKGFAEKIIGVSITCSINKLNTVTIDCEKFKIISSRNNMKVTSIFCVLINMTYPSWLRSRHSPHPLLFSLSFSLQ